MDQSCLLLDTEQDTTPQGTSITWEAGHAKYKSRDQWGFGPFQSDSGCDTHSQTN